MGVGLVPLEFTECLADSPHFRENLLRHEKELERTSQQVKRLIKEVKDVVHAAKRLGAAQLALAGSMENFEFACIGASMTEDERVISHSLHHFAKLMRTIEDERERMLGRAHEQIIAPLERFRKEHIGAVKEGKKKFDKKTAKFCQSQERTLSLSTKKPDNVFQEADAAMDMAERDFCQASLEYVFQLQAVREREKFELVETLLGFVFSWWTFHHTAHDVHHDAEPLVRDLQLRIQRVSAGRCPPRRRAARTRLAAADPAGECWPVVGRLEKFELMELLLGFVFSWWTFHHTAHDVHHDAEPLVRDLQLRIQRTRTNFEETSKQTESLMKKMMEVRQMNKEVEAEETGEAADAAGGVSRAGYLYLMEKSECSPLCYITCSYIQNKEVEAEETREAADAAGGVSRAGYLYLMEKSECSPLCYITCSYIQNKEVEAEETGEAADAAGGVSRAGYLYLMEKSECSPLCYITCSSIQNKEVEVEETGEAADAAGGVSRAGYLYLMEKSECSPLCYITCSSIQNKEVEVEETGEAADAAGGVSRAGYLYLMEKSECSPLCYITCSSIQNKEVEVEETGEAADAAGGVSRAGYLYLMEKSECSPLCYITCSSIQNKEVEVEETGEAADAAGGVSRAGYLYLMEKSECSPLCYITCSYIQNKEVEAEETGEAADAAGGVSRAGYLYLMEKSECSPLCYITCSYIQNKEVEAEETGEAADAAGGVSRAGYLYLMEKSECSPLCYITCSSIQNKEVEVEETGEAADAAGGVSRAGYLYLMEKSECSPLCYITCSSIQNKEVEVEETGEAADAAGGVSRAGYLYLMEKSECSPLCYITCSYIQNKEVEAEETGEAADAAGGVSRAGYLYLMEKSECSPLCYITCSYIQNKEVEAEETGEAADAAGGVSRAGYLYLMEKSECSPLCYITCSYIQNKEVEAEETGEAADAAGGVSRAGYLYLMEKSECSPLCYITCSSIQNKEVEAEETGEAADAAGGVSRAGYLYLMEKSECSPLCYITCSSIQNKEVEAEETGEAADAAGGVSRAGYLYLMEKKAFGTAWSKHYCTYEKNSRTLRLLPYSQINPKTTAPAESVCVCGARRAADTERRFCWDALPAERERPPLTLQALSERDRGAWLRALSPQVCTETSAGTRCRPSASGRRSRCRRCPSATAAPGCGRSVHRYVQRLLLGCAAGRARAAAAHAAGAVRARPRRLAAGAQSTGMYRDFCWDALPAERERPPLTLQALSERDRGAWLRALSTGMYRDFCWDALPAERERPPLTLQALSERDRGAWLRALSPQNGVAELEGGAARGAGAGEAGAQLDDAGFAFVRRLIQVLEERGLEEQGLYRVAGVASKVSRLVQCAAGGRLPAALADPLEWESKTLTSALKSYLRALPEPLATHALHARLLAAAKLESRAERVGAVAALVAQLPQRNRDMLRLVVDHLRCELPARLRMRRGRARRAAPAAEQGHAAPGRGPLEVSSRPGSGCAVAALVAQLPQRNRDMLRLVVDHLRRVAARSERNLMTPSNLAVCFGPTLLRAPRESVAAILDLKFYNVLVETLLDHADQIFQQGPQAAPVPQATPAQNGLRNKENILPNAAHSRNVWEATWPAWPDWLLEVYQIPERCLSEALAGRWQVATCGSRARTGPRAPIADRPAPYIPRAAPATPSLQPSGEPCVTLNTDLVSLCSEVYCVVSELFSAIMIICLSGFVIAGASPAPLSSALLRAADCSTSVPAMPPGGGGGARYSPHHQQLLQHFAPPQLAALRGATRSSSSSAESVSSSSASPPPPGAPAPLPLPLLPPLPPPHAAAAAPLHARLYTHPYSRRVRTLYACLGESEGELSFEPNQIITNVTASAEPGWLRGTLNGKSGLVPENYVEPLP
ncbi:LOW QUALITY PROTEIN: uncharacterized protein LOC133525231 [Cydia pomonella]|uniref:LOW QUALITY PROTEIN: uncharacterized protein LOC133525231 n=1 Tax=Cydia pomonella TaxID=82600 RepID=UPI002ADDB434|nr:LOW QUALITY PROTEIN: uncharacterized protein LOC133525231 [Cydia pomonella]